ncbi:DUF397 domain-containing protein [Streptomyces ossamyceticus]
MRTPLGATAPEARQGVVPVRDSKNPDGPVLVINRSAWQHFLDAVPTFS